jgi:Protein of unknown function (DUF3223)
MQLPAAPIRSEKINMATEVIFDKYKIASQAKAIKAAQQVRDRHPLKTPIRDIADHEFIDSLFRKHPGYESKVAGRTVSHYEVHPNVGGSHCFYAIFVGGGMIDFSFHKAIEAAATTSKIT